jgi:hypothetical protein
MFPHWLSQAMIDAQNAQNAFEKRKQARQPANEDTKIQENTFSQVIWEMGLMLLAALSVAAIIGVTVHAINDGTVLHLR